MNISRKILQITMSAFIILASLSGIVVTPIVAQESLELNSHVEFGNLDTDTEGVLRVGMEANYTPFNWSQASDANGAVPIANSPGEYANGYDVWMSQRLADGLGLQLEVIKIEWDGLVPALQSGRIDAIVAGMSPTSERQEVIDFSSTYYTADLVMMVSVGSEYENATSIHDFSDARVTAQMNTFHYGVLDQIEGLTPQPALDAFPTMLTALNAGSIDAFAAERPAAYAAVAANSNVTFVEFDEENGFETSPEDTNLAIGLRKGSELREPLNVVLEEITEDERQSTMEFMIEIEANPDQESLGFWGTTTEILEEFGPLFLRGAGVTLLIALVSTTVGFIIGLFVQIIREIPLDKRNSRVRNALVGFGQWLLTAYVEIFRGTPMMVQAMLIFYGSRLFFGIDMSSLTAALLIVSINTGAYLAEVIKGGIASVDKGQLEACKAIGLTHNQTMRRVILPQTIKAILPTIGNEFVVNIKDTSVLNVISVTELFFITRSVAGTTLQVFHTYLITAVIYFVLTFITTRVINWIGKRNGATEAFTLRSASA